MIHPSYNELIEKINTELEEGEMPVVESRYSVVIAAAKRARQLIDTSSTLGVRLEEKPLSTAISELYHGDIKIMSNEDYEQGLAEREKARAALEEETRLAGLELQKSIDAELADDEAPSVELTSDMTADDDQE